MLGALVGIVVMIGDNANMLGRGEGGFRGCTPGKERRMRRWRVPSLVDITARTAAAGTG